MTPPAIFRGYHIWRWYLSAGDVCTKGRGFASSSMINSSRLLHHVFRPSDDKSFWCFMHGAWTSSRLQKYLPISAQCCAGWGGKGPGRLASRSHDFQLCPQGVRLSSWGTRPQAWARGASLGSWVCSPGMQLICGPGIPREQATDSEIPTCNGGGDLPRSRTKLNTLQGKV